MRDIITEVRKFISELPKKSPHILLGVSGGLDSMVLLSILSSLREDEKIKISVAHIDHSIRPDSYLDKELVEATCQQLEIPFYSRKISPPSSNLEAWGREERYKFFNELAKEFACDFIATAHHKGDLVETFLFKLLTGRINSLSTPIKAVDLDRQIIRPLLTFTKEEIFACSDAYQIAYREDSTNSDQSYKRNFIRHSVLPNLKKLEAQSEEHIEEYIASITAVDNFLKAEALKFVGANLIEKVRLNDVLLERVLVLESVKYLGDEAYKISRNRILELMTMIRTPAESQRECDLGFGFCAVIDHRGAENGCVYFFNCSELEKPSEVIKVSDREFNFNFRGGYKGLLLIDPSEQEVEEVYSRFNIADARLVNENSHALPVENCNLECRSPIEGERVVVGDGRTRLVSKIYKDESWNAERRWCSVLIGNNENYYLIGSRFFHSLPLNSPPLSSLLPVKTIQIKFLSFLTDKV